VLGLESITIKDDGTWTDPDGHGGKLTVTGTHVTWGPNVDGVLESDGRLSLSDHERTIYFVKEDLRGFIGRWKSVPPLPGQFESFTIKDDGTWTDHDGSPGKWTLIGTHLMLGPTIDFVLESDGRLSSFDHQKTVYFVKE
jgi:hypothetical protein